MTPEQYKLALELTNNPPSGSKLADAKEYGIDLTLLVSSLNRTPTERAERLVAGARSLRMLRAATPVKRAHG